MRSLEDRSFSIVVVAVAAALGWKVIGVGERRGEPATPPARTTATVEARVLAVAEAIAIAEGYYAPGDHDGRSLPYRLNNPGSLKKPAAGTEGLPTWYDTGLVVFPTPETGWAALRYQVCTMLSGRSRIYHPSDSLVRVGVKYADGDLNWGPNVAAMLGVAPEATLDDLVNDTRIAWSGC